MAAKLLRLMAVELALCLVKAGYLQSRDLNFNYR